LFQKRKREEIKYGGGSGEETKRGGATKISIESVPDFEGLASFCNEKGKQGGLMGTSLFGEVWGGALRLSKEKGGGTSPRDKLVQTAMKGEGVVSGKKEKKIKKGKKKEGPVPSESANLREEVELIALHVEKVYLKQGSDVKEGGGIISSGRA